MLNGEINMSVSSMTRKDGEKAVYVLFADKSRSAEFTLPELKLLNSNGFSTEEIKKLTEYVDNERVQIMELARTVNPMKMLKERV